MATPRETINVLCLSGDSSEAIRRERLLETFDNNIQVTTATGMAAGYRELQSGTFDCVVCEEKLHEGCSRAFVELIRANDPTIPFILCSAARDKGAPSDAFAAGVSDYVEITDHPEAVEKLASRIRIAVRRQRALQDGEVGTEACKAMLDGAPDPVLVMVDGETSYCNPAGRALLGTERRPSLRSTPLSERIESAVDRPQLLTESDPLSRWQGSIQQPGEDILVDGISGRITWDGSVGHVLVLRELPGAEGEDAVPADHRQSNGIIDAISAAVFLKTAAGEYLQMNEQCRELLNLTGADVVGMTDDDLFSAEIAERVREDDRAVLAAGETLEFEEQIPAEAGEKLLLTRKTPLYDNRGEPFALCGVATDITHQKQREHELAERVKELSAIHDTIDLFDSDKEPTDSLLGTFLDGLSDSFECPETTAARLTYGDLEVANEDYTQQETCLTVSTSTGEGPPLEIEVVRTDTDETPFLDEERELLETLAAVVAGYLERRDYISELERYEATLRALGDPVYAMDENGRFTFVNDALIEQTNYTREQLLGEHTSIILSPEAVERGRAAIVELLTDPEKQTAKWEMNLIRAGGEEVPSENHVALLPFDENDSFRGTAGVIRDVSDRVEREAELRRRRDLLVRTEQMADVGGWELNLETEQLYWTEGTRQIHDVPAEYEPTLGDGIEYFHPDDRPELEEAVRECREDGRPYDLELRLVTASGRELWVNVRGERVEENGTSKLRGTIQNVTRLRENEQQLMVLNRVLRHNLRNNLNVVTANADLLREHLRTLEPLSAVPDLRADIEIDEILVAEEPGPDTDREAIAECLDAALAFPLEEAIEKLDRLEANTWKLLTFAEKSRELAAAIDETDRAEAVSIGVLLQSVVEEYRGAYPEATIELTSQECTVEASSASLQLVISEILENALEHTDEPHPTVSISTARIDGSRLRVTISDDGPGIPEAEREALECGEETALRHGSGVGLWIVNWLLGRLGGTIRIADETSEGTTVHLEIPTA